MIIANFNYYQDVYHTRYKRSIFHSPEMVAFKTIYGFSTWLRSVWKFALWGVTGLFWVLTFIPLRVFKELFAYIILGMMAAELVRIVAIILVDCAAILGDDFDKNSELRSETYS
jgi:hypothetical protein